MNSILVWIPSWQFDKDQGNDYQYQFHLKSYQLVIMLLNPACLMLFLDLTRSFIQARKLVGFLWSSLCKLVGYGAFIKQCLIGQKGFLSWNAAGQRLFSVLNCAFLRPLLLINVALSLTTLITYWIKSLIYDQLTNIASWDEIFSRNQCTVLNEYWEHKAYCLPVSFILAGIKAVFSTKEFAKGDLVWSSSSH